MEYKFKSVFNREEEFTIICDKDLTQYDIFSLTISKVDNHKKDYSPSNINCTLRYFKRNDWRGESEIELESYNFVEYQLFVEKFKNRNCTSMGLGIDLVREEKPQVDVTYDNASPELRKAFDEAMEGDFKKALFKAFLQGVEYGKGLKS